jgi:hypothetical protein
LNRLGLHDVSDVGWRLTPLGRRALAHARLFGTAPDVATGTGEPRP